MEPHENLSERQVWSLIKPLIIILLLIPFKKVYIHFARRRNYLRTLCLCYTSTSIMTHIWAYPFESMDQHLAIIQALIAHGAKTEVKATFTLTKHESDTFTTTKEVETSIELTASECFRKITGKIICHENFGPDAFLHMAYHNEYVFLKNCTHETPEQQISLHKKFHQL